MLKDSGQRRIFSTGGQRDRGERKGRFDLLPPYAIYKLAKHFEDGADKYEARNWEKGIPLSTYIDSALRHIFKHLGGLTDEPHLVAAAWNIICAVETKYRVDTDILPKELNDLPKQTWKENNFANNN